MARERDKQKPRPRTRPGPMQQHDRTGSSSAFSANNARASNQRHSESRPQSAVRIPPRDLHRRRTPSPPPIGRRQQHYDRHDSEHDPYKHQNRQPHQYYYEDIEYTGYRQSVRRRNRSPSFREPLPVMYGRSGRSRGYSGHHGSYHHSQNPPYGRHHQPGYSDTSYRGRGSGHTQPASPARGGALFQNLSWTPDKGSRGGIAPSERLPNLPASSKKSDSEPTSNDDGSNRSVDGARGDEASEQSRKNSARDEATPADGSDRPNDSNDFASQKDPEAASTPKAPSIKFAMKVQSPKTTLTKPNVMQSQSASKPPLPRQQTAPPSRPSLDRGPPEPYRQADYFNSSRGRPPPQTRPGPSRHDDRPPYKQPPPSRDPYYNSRDARDSRDSRDLRENQDPRDSRDPRDLRDSRDSRDYPYPPPSGRDRRPLPPDPWETARSRGKPLPPSSRLPPRSSKPRRKRTIKIKRKKWRVVLPPKQLPKDWAESNFIYYPKPDKNSVVGAGTYGKVFKAHNVYMRKVVALKTLPLIKPRRKTMPQPRDKKRKRQERWVRDGFHLTSIREIKLLKSTSHQDDNIVSIREIFLEGNTCNLVFDYFEFDFHGIIYSAKVGLEAAMLKDLTRQMFCGLDFLHRKAHILHRDIKAANILVSANGLVKITDFGLAKKIKPGIDWSSVPWYKKKFEHSNRVITTPYRPPELLLGSTLYGGEVDVWSGGCVLFEAFLRRLPFQGTGEDVDHLLTLWKVLGMPNPRTYGAITELEWYWLINPRVKPKHPRFSELYGHKLTPELHHLLRCIFQHDPAKRPTAAQVLRHPFFTSENPLPISAGATLQTVEGEWHELEYKMLRDKEKAESRRRQEDNVIVAYLEAHAMADDLAAYQAKIQHRALAEKDAEGMDHATAVAQIKASHGDVYMDASRRSGRYRVEREKTDEKLLSEAWRWWQSMGKSPPTDERATKKARV